MPRKSSTMAKINDTITILADLIKQAQEEINTYVEDAEKYRELKPMLNKLAARTGGQDKTGGQDDTGGQDKTGGQNRPPKGSRKKNNAADRNET
jgi:hypothetical protein